MSGKRFINDSLESRNSLSSTKDHRFSSPFTDSSVRSSAASQGASVEFRSDADADDNYLDRVSSNVADADRYLQRINSISSNMASSSAKISSGFAKVNRLNQRTGLGSVTLSDNQLFDNANQSVAIEMIKVNNQKIKAMVAKNKISGMTFRVKLDYKNYLKAQKAIETDVTGINSDISTQSGAFGQGIDVLNSHNSLVTSYASQLSLDVNNASLEISHVSTAASYAGDSQRSASSAYDQVSQLVDSFQQRVVSTARSNAAMVNAAASQTSKLFSRATSYGQQVSAIASSYSNNSAIARSNTIVSSALQSIGSRNGELERITSDTISRLKNLDPSDVDSLGESYRQISSSASEAVRYQDQNGQVYSKLASAASNANSVADELHAEQEALYDGANAYEPIVKEPVLSSKNRSVTYIKYYKQGYQEAKRGFSRYVHQTLANQHVNDDNHSTSYQIGFKNAIYFIKGIDDAKKRIIKDNKLIDVKNYNYGYNSYRSLLDRSRSLNVDESVSPSLNGSVLLIFGFLIGQNR